MTFFTSPSACFLLIGIDHLEDPLVQDLVHDSLSKGYIHTLTYRRGRYNVSLSAEEKRKKRINQLAGKIQTSDIGEIGGGSYLSLRLLLGWGQLQWGCKSERVREYLEALEQAGMVEIKEDVVTWIGSS